MQVLYDGVKRFSMLSLTALLAVNTIGLGAVGARPLTPAEARRYPYDGFLPACGDPNVVSRI